MSEDDETCLYCHCNVTRGQGVKEYDVICTHTTAYPMRRAVTGEQWSEKLGSKRMVKSTPPSPIEKVSTSESQKKKYRLKMTFEDIQHQTYS